MGIQKIGVAVLQRANVGSEREIAIMTVIAIQDLSAVQIIVNSLILLRKKQQTVALKRHLPLLPPELPHLQVLLHLLLQLIVQVTINIVSNSY